MLLTLTRRQPGKCFEGFDVVSAGAVSVSTRQKPCRGTSSGAKRICLVPQVRTAGRTSPEMLRSHGSYLRKAIPVVGEETPK